LLVPVQSRAPDIVPPDKSHWPSDSNGAITSLGAFLELHQKIQLEVVMDDRKRDLVAENIDVALRLDVFADSALVGRKLAQGPRLVLASQAYLDRKGVPRNPADLSEHDGIVYNQSTGGEDWVSRRGPSETKVRIPAA